LNKTTLLFGATSNPARYAYMAAQRLLAANYDFRMMSVKKGSLFGQDFIDLQDQPALSDIHTITLYVGTANLDQWKNYILSLNPKRIIFNPGTEHASLAEEAEEKGIEVIFGCTLVMLSTGQY